MRIAVLRETMDEARDAARPLRDEGHDVTEFSWSCPDVSKVRGRRFERLDWRDTRYPAHVYPRQLDQLDALLRASVEATRAEGVEE